ncbi:hypothetical protein AB0M36_05155 [Actinoplanes sp. NPDC051346]|uniref:hypothetical protein n=1 Tax=Actinoplanes sp. NPDC051346 TaxID=3155048 RepID=UPI00343727B9
MNTARPRLTRAGELAGVVSAVVGLTALAVAIFAWLDPRAPTGEASPAAASLAPSPVAVSLAPSPRPSPSLVEAPPFVPVDSRGLADLEISSGRANTAPVPKKFTGARYRDAVAIPCGTGEAKDQFREIRYETGGGYDTFHAVLAPTGDVRTSVQVEVFVGGVVRGNDVIGVGREKAVDLEISGAATLGVRVTCSTRNAMLLILRSALV